jgi:hypothetical protein
VIRNALGTRHARGTARPPSVVDGKNINTRRALVRVISELKISRPVVGNGEKKCRRIAALFVGNEDFAGASMGTCIDSVDAGF